MLSDTAPVREQGKQERGEEEAEPPCGSPRDHRQRELGCPFAVILNWDPGGLNFCSSI